MKPLFLLLGQLLAFFTAAGQGISPADIQFLHGAQVRHTMAARALLTSPTGKAPATEYLQALQTWYGSDLPASVQGAAAEEFFAAHQSILRQRAASRKPPTPALAAVHDSSTAHLRQLTALTKTAHRLPEPAQLRLVRRVAAREQALWIVAQAQGPKAGH